MQKLFFIFLFLFISLLLFAQQKTIHVFVALCDNEHQGIVQVPKHLGNGKDPRGNLYWGAAYGIKNYFTNKTTDWTLVKSFPSENPAILERLLFKHATREVYLLAEAYDGEQIKQTVEDFLKAANAHSPSSIQLESQVLNFGGKADLLAYIGHDGLMDFSVDIQYTASPAKEKEVIILACYSKKFFESELTKANAKPVLWTTHLMAPEAYTLKAAIDGWMNRESGNEIAERAAQAYHHYQKCGINGARKLLVSGF